MTNLSAARFSWPGALANGGVACLVGGSVLLIFGYAPTEATMGEVQRILYFHVAVAWCGLWGCLAMGACGAGYLLRRNLTWDWWSQAAGETGWLCATLTLVSGSLWAKAAWNTWWTWEPRLTASLVLWLIYAGIFLVRSSLDDAHRRARFGAVLAILGLSDIPLIVMATRWFRGVHPVTPEMDPRMRLVLLAAVVSFTVFFVTLLVQRRRQLELADRIAMVENQLESVWNS